MHINTLIAEGVIDRTGYIQTSACKCSSCGSPVNIRHYDSCYGGCVNSQKSFDCPSCGHHSCDDEGCNTCNAAYELRCKQETALYLGITSSVEALFYLSKIETQLMVIYHKAEISFGAESFCDVAATLIDELEEVSDHLCSYSETQYAAHPVSREIMRSISSLLGKTTEILGVGVN